MEFALKKDSRKELRANCKVKCNNCFELWRADGAKPNEKPPFHAVGSYEICPVCGNKLSPAMAFGL